MSLNKVQLIGNVGKDPDVRYLDNGVAVATFSLATTDRAYTLAMGLRFLNVPNGIILFCGEDWRKRLKSMFAKEISFISKVKSAAVFTMIRMVSNVLSLKSLLITWKC